MNFAEEIKSVRQKSLLSQNDFAKLLGVSFSTINRWENGRTIPKWCKLKLISEFCKEQKIAFNIEKFIENRKGSNIARTE